MPHLRVKIRDMFPIDDILRMGEPDESLAFLFTPRPIPDRSKDRIRRDDIYTNDRQC